MMRLTMYASGSVALAAGVLIKAVHERANFFSACIYLSHSNACKVILVNLLVLLIGTVVFGLQRILYGPLRPVEAEQLYDKAWFAITETCLAMTIFREEIGVWFIILFMSLLAGKVWAWIGEGRVEVLDQQPPANPRIFHARLATSLFLSLAFDVFLLNHSISTVRHQAKPNMMVMFAFEFAVLTTSSVSTALRYLISLREAVIIRRMTRERIHELREQRERTRTARRGAVDVADAALDAADYNDDLDESQIETPEWEDKSRWVLYLELLTDLVRLALYLVFFVVLCVFYGMPLHIIRDVLIALRSFHKRLTDFIKYRQATRDMDERYRDASLEDIGSNDVCIICREIMRPWQGPDTNTDQRSRPKKLPCGHVLHFSCLRRWLQWQQNCPTCRQPVLENTSHNGASPVPVAQAPAIAPIQAQDARPTAPIATEPQDIPVQDRNQPQHQHQNAGPERFGNEVPDNERERPEDPVQNGWRRFQFGPLVLDVGARHNLHQAPATADQTYARASAHQTVHNTHQTDPPLLETSQAAAILYQVDLLERQLIAQTNSLRLAVSQLARLQASNDESIQAQDYQHNESSATFQVFRNNQISMPIHAGSSELPQGLVLPEGWTLTPLNRVSAGPLHLMRSAANATGSQARAPSTATRHTSIQSSQSSQTGQTAVQHQRLESRSVETPIIREDESEISVNATENESSSPLPSTTEVTDPRDSARASENVRSVHNGESNEAEHEVQESSRGDHRLPRRSSNNQISRDGDTG